MNEPASRIDDLRRRVLAIQGQSPDGDLVALDRRILRLSQRIQQRTWQAAAESTRDLDDSLVPSSLPMPQSSGASQDFLLRVSQMLAGIQPLRARLADIGRSAVLADRPVERATLARARQIVDVAERMMREAKTSVNHQIVLIPAWESMLREASDHHARLAALLRWHECRFRQVAMLREIFSQLLAGGRIRLEAVTDLAGAILHDVDDEPQPDILQPSHFEPAVVVATHAVNVAHFAGHLASIDPDRRPLRLGVVIASLFMDVGMLKAAPDVLRSKKTLDEFRKADVERHPIESSVIVERIAGFDESLAYAIVTHHEREHGGGYPSGMASAEIPPVAKLLAVSDSYVAMRSRRAHRPPVEPQLAYTRTLAEANAGRLDEPTARLLLGLSMYPVGSIVELASAEIAEVVASQNARTDPTLAALPIVRLLFDKQGARVSIPIYRNLASRPECRIIRTISPEEVFARRQAV